LTEQVAAAVLLASTQAIELRLRAGDLNQHHLVPALLQMKDAVLAEFEFLAEDRPLEGDLRHFVGRINEQVWPLYDEL
jgi:histidine ammonia-lyase